MKKIKQTPVFTVLFMILLTLFSKALGMVRQMLMASIFAAGTEGVAFSAASKLPFAIFDMLFATAIIGSFLPIYRGHLLSDEKRAIAFSSVFFTFTGGITAIFAIFGILFAKPLLLLTAPNLDAQTLALSVKLLRILFPAVVFAGLVYTLIGILQSHEKFFLPAAVSTVSNLFMIVFLLFCGFFNKKVDAVTGLAVIYLLSWFAQFLTLTIPLIKMRKMPCFSFKFKHPDLILAEKRALPVMFGAWLIPMTTLTANAFSSYIDIEGFASGAAIVVYENAFSVFTIAGGLVTYGVCNYLFPKLSAKFASGDENGFASSARMGLGIVLAITLPIAVFVFLTAEEIIGFLFLRGSFTLPLANAAAESLQTLSLALPAYGVIEFLSRSSYSAGKARHPLFAALLGIAVVGASSLACYVADMLTVRSVAFCAVLGFSTAALMLCCFSRRIFTVGMTKKITKIILLFLSGIVLSSLSMAGIHRILKNFTQKTTTFTNFMTIALVFLLGLVVYLIWIIFWNRTVFSKSTSGKEDFSDGSQ